jgi:hypothetical protein
MSALYFKAWNTLFNEKSRTMKQVIIDEPKGHVADALAHETALLAEKWASTYGSSECEHAHMETEQPTGPWTPQDDYI